MPVPDFSPGEVLTAAAMDSIGLWLVKSQAVGTGVTSVTVTGAFSADYDNYKILYSGGTLSVDTDIYLTIGGSSTGYYGFMTYGLVGGGILGASKNNAASCSWVGGGAAGEASQTNVEVMNPFKSLYTKIRNGNYQNGSNYGTMQAEHRVATSYTSFALGVDSGTMTGGTIRVYGYRN
jgi:hypothetical protein